MTEPYALVWGDNRYFQTVRWRNLPEWGRHLEHKFPSRLAALEYAAVTLRCERREIRDALARVNGMIRRERAKIERGQE